LNRVVIAALAAGLGYQLLAPMTYDLQRWVGVTARR
jgi:hypothetical protein